MATTASTVLAFGLLTLATLVACDRVVDALVDRTVERQYADLLAGAERFEAIVIGSSHTAFGVDVAALETPATRPYNFANPHSGPLYFEPWYRLFRARQGPPKLVLVGADWAWPHQPAELTTDADLLPAADWLAAMRAKPAEAPALFFQRFALVKEQAGMLQRLFAEPYRFDIDVDRYHRGGAPIVPKPYRDSPNSHKQQAKAPVPPGAWPAFERLCAALAADGARVAFVQVPEYLPVVGRHPHETAPIAALAARHGWPFLNYNAERASALNEDRSLFMDWGHLNAIGRARFSWKLRGDLMQLGLLGAGR